MKNSDILNLILADIKVVNTNRSQPIASDDSNEEIQFILHKHLGDLGVEEWEHGVSNLDTEEFLVDFFDYEGYEAIREAEQDVIIDLKPLGNVQYI